MARLLTTFVRKDSSTNEAFVTRVTRNSGPSRVSEKKVKIQTHAEKFTVLRRNEESEDEENKKQKRNRTTTKKLKAKRQ